MSLTADRTETDRQTFDSTNPATGEVVGTFPVHDSADAQAAVKRARDASVWWRDLGFDGRRARLRKVQGALTRRREELLDLMHRENGKPVDEALFEVTLVLEHLEWAGRNAKKVLGPQRVPGSRTLLNMAGELEYEPFGVIGVIGPWNYPLFTPMGSIAYALAAGNAVVFKPSEYTPAVGLFIEEIVREAVPEQPVLQVVTGFGETGAALCRAGVDKVAFTGSAPTGKKIMAACAETLTPVLMELGGKNAMIVDADADIGRAASAALFGGCSNAGQTCIGVERVYVVDSVYDRFVDEIVRRAEGIKGGADGATLGPITMPKQVDIIAAHINEALDRGARAVVGGRDSVHAPYVDPVVLVDVPADARVLREETFGPVLPIVPVRDVDEAVRLANGTSYGLGASVWARKRGREIARQLRSGMAAINSVMSFAGFAALPFGGVGDSGFGRIHGADGLKEFTRAKAIARERFALPIDVMSFDAPAWMPRMLRRLQDWQYGRR
ncbi:MAG TPA: aldehyde dehydrogenase family protein [Mycobacteriales bacterium]|nr:aldehyde dehydrogenase family protein [Mycobacteriales bacterium]